MQQDLRERNLLAYLAHHSIEHHPFVCGLGVHNPQALLGLQEYKEIADTGNHPAPGPRTPGGQGLGGQSVCVPGFADQRVAAWKRLMGIFKGVPGMCSGQIKSRLRLGLGRRHGWRRLRIARTHRRAPRLLRISAIRIQRHLQGVDHRVADGMPLAKTHLALGGMYIHIDHARLEIDKQEQDRVFILPQRSLVGLVDGIMHECCTRGPAIDKDKLVAPIISCELRHTRITANMHTQVLQVHGKDLVEQARV